MKEINVAEVKHLCFLSGLEFNEKEILDFIPKFNELLDLCNEINECDTSNVKKVYSIHGVEDLREDVEKDSLSVEDVIKNSPKSKRDCFAVPLMMEE